MQRKKHVITDDVRLSLKLEFNGDTYSNCTVELPKGTELEQFGIDDKISKIFDEDRRIQIIRTIIALAS